LALTVPENAEAVDEKAIMTNKIATLIFQFSSNITSKLTF